MLRKIQAPIQVASEAVSRMSHLARELWDLVVALPYRVDLSVQTQDGSHHSDTNALVISDDGRHFVIMYMYWNLEIINPEYRTRCRPSSCDIQNLMMADTLFCSANHPFEIFRYQVTCHQC